MIAEIREKIKNDLFELSKYAVDQSIIRHVSIQGLREAIMSGKIIEVPR